MGPIHLSGNGFDYLETYLMTIYGNRGSYKHNLQRYLSSDEFRCSCRLPRAIHQIPELTQEQLISQIKREEHFRQRCDNMIAQYDKNEKENSMSQEDYLEIAGILGLCPGNCDWHECLFPHLVDLFVSSKQEADAIWKNVESHLKIIKAMVFTMCNGLRNEQCMNYNGRILWSHGYARNYFRGENAYYGQSHPSMFRSLPPNTDEKNFSRFIDLLRILEFSLWINQLEFVKSWPYGDIYHGAIAQHYGLRTNGLDITNDLKVALFFSCCKWQDNRWLPLQPSDFQNADSRKDIAALGGDSRYGIIFSAPTDVANMSHAANLSDLRVTNVTPVGIHPFLRCSHQSAFVIECDETYDLYKDTSFAKFKFRHTEEICNWIFNEMEQGKLIYPNEDGLLLGKVISKIQSEKIFSKAAFDKALNELNHPCDTTQLQQMFYEKNYLLVENRQLCSTEETQEINGWWHKQLSQSSLFSKPPQISPTFSV